MVEPFREELLNPASVDVLLGDNIMIEVADQKELVLMSIAERTAEDPYWMLPKRPTDGPRPTLHASVMLKRKIRGQ